MGTIHAQDIALLDRIASDLGSSHSSDTLNLPTSSHLNFDIIIYILDDVDFNYLKYRMTSCSKVEGVPGLPALQI